MSLNTCDFDAFVISVLNLVHITTGIHTNAQIKFCLAANLQQLVRLQHIYNMHNYRSFNAENVVLNGSVLLVSRVEFFLDVMLIHNKGTTLLQPGEICKWKGHFYTINMSDMRIGVNLENKSLGLWE